MDIARQVELLLLAAGRGSRMGELTACVPKALLEVNGLPIIEQTVSAFYNTFPDGSMRIVTGYNSSAFKEWVNSHNWEVELAYNKDWNSYGPTGSLNIGLQKEFEGEQLFIGNGDTLFSKQIFDTIISSQLCNGFYLVCSEIIDFEQDAMLLDIKYDRIYRAGKRIMIEPHPKWESSGLLVVIGTENINKLIKKVQNLVSQVQNGCQSDGPWHEIVNLLIRDGEEIEPILVPGLSWLECDTHQCILNAERVLSK